MLDTFCSFLPLFRHLLSLLSHKKQEGCNASLLFFMAKRVPRKLTFASSACKIEFAFEPKADESSLTRGTEVPIRAYLLVNIPNPLTISEKLATHRWCYFSFYSWSVMFLICICVCIWGKHSLLYC